jgi:UPF0716 protein FxsA
MVGLLILLFIVVPIIELAVFVQVADLVGVGTALALVVLFSFGGAWLMKQQGLSVWRRAQAQLQAGELPTNELVNGILILFAGALMLTPGFATDVLGIFLLLPPTRALVRTALLRRYERRIRAAFGVPGGAPFGPSAAGGFATRRVFTGPASMGDVYDVREVDTDPSPRPPSGPSGRRTDRPELGRY